MKQDSCGQASDGHSSCILFSRGGNKRAVGAIYLQDGVCAALTQEICG
jgi:hypothetical protein